MQALDRRSGMTLTGFTITEWVAFGSAAIALISLVTNWFVLRRQLRLHQEEIRTAVDAERGRWCADALTAFETASSWFETPADAPSPPGETPHLVAARLSTLADLGRLHFPNFDPNNHGSDKAAAFRGHRQPAIDAMLLVHDLMRDAHRLPPASRVEAAALVFDCRRLLISEVQIASDPRRLAVLAPSHAHSVRAVRRDTTRQIEPLAQRLAALDIEARSFGGKRPF